MLRRIEDRDDPSPQQFCQQWDEGGSVEEEEEELLDSDDEEDLATRMEGTCIEMYQYLINKSSLVLVATH